MLKQQVKDINGQQEPEKKGKKTTIKINYIHFIFVLNTIVTID